MRQSEILKHATAVLELMESRNLSEDDMHTVITRVMGTLMAQKFVDDMDKKKKEENQFDKIFDKLQTKN